MEAGDVMGGVTTIGLTTDLELPAQVEEILSLAEARSDASLSA